MNARRITPGSFIIRQRDAARGFTLLEILVALGIIIGALAGIGALLPAAGARLGEATEIDRAGTMAANARADLFTRGLLRADMWPTVSGSVRAVVFGDGLSSGTIPHVTVAAATASVVAARIDLATGFRLPDNLQAAASGICYGCMLSSTTTPTGPGDRVRMTTVVFRKPAPTVKRLTLTQTGSNSPVFTSGSGPLAAADRKQLLAGCSWALAVSPGSQVQEPRWVPIAASWTTFAPGQTTGSPTGTSYVTLAGKDYAPFVSGGQLIVFGFDGLLRADERFVTLE